MVKEKVYSFIQNEEYFNIIAFELCGTTYPNKNYLISRPKSSTACIEYVDKGAGVVNIGNKSFSPSEGDSYFLHPGIDQYYYSNPDNPWKKYFINISGPLVDALIEGYNLSGQFYFPGLDIKCELLKIIEIAKSKNVGYGREVIHIINEMLFKMYEHLKESSSSVTPAQEIMDFLNTKIETGFKMCELCEHISKSESQTIKIFKKAYGITPYSYVLNKKIELAKNLLTNTNMSIQEISARLNFADEYYFSNLFKQKAGFSPSKYRIKNM